MSNRPVETCGLMDRVVAYLLAVLLGGYGALLALFGGSLWELDTYHAALAVPGGVVTWAVAAMVSAVLLLVGSAAELENIVGAGATLAAVWLIFFAIMFATSAATMGSPLALPGVLVYGVCGIVAATRAGIAAGLR